MTFAAAPRDCATAQCRNGSQGERIAERSGEGNREHRWISKRILSVSAHRAQMAVCCQLAWPRSVRALFGAPIESRGERERTKGVRRRRRSGGGRARPRACRFPRALWVGVASLLPAGCAYLPKDSRPATPIDPPAMAKTVASVAPEAVSVADGWPRNFWWRKLECSELDRIMQLALTSNPDLRAALDRVHQAWVMAAGERSRYLPSAQVRPWLANSIFGVWGFPGSSFFGPFGENSFFFWDILPMFTSYHVDLWGEDRARIRAAAGRRARRSPKSPWPGCSSPRPSPAASFVLPRSKTSSGWRGGARRSPESCSPSRGCAAAGESTASFRCIRRRKGWRRRARRRPGSSGRA
ncbi:protein of unknown function [Methylacidimicrobium sp. AP8]|nr:protein of unknown function [Methylacidimicrobium sp. AP8]